MPYTTIALLDALANVLIAASALGVAALIALRLNQQSSARREPLGIVFCFVFLAVGVRAIVRVTVHNGALTPASMTSTVLVVDWLTVAAMVGFLFLRRRYGVFIESAHMVREYETEYAAKDREARALAQ